HAIQLGSGVDGALRALLTDPQTSGGLLVSCAPEAVESVLATFRRHGCAEAAVIGQLDAGEPGIEVA
ncbi:MAG TPA: AIR synthase-related protein, partial [Steroidobacteraceae bacterium]|nr:AIR synthase-related protein [Steroidobacteraceae bacterium]